MAGTSATKTVELFGVASSTVSKVMTAFEKEEKTSSLKQNSGRKRKLSDRDHRTLMRIVRKDHKNTALKIQQRIMTILKSFFKNYKGAAQSWISWDGSNQKTILK